MGKYFGTDGFRGEVNTVLNAEHAFRVGRLLGWYFGQDEGKKARIVIGKDTRRSSYMLEYALAAGLTSSGADAYILHVISTPGVSFICRTEDFCCGVMISASHNRFEDNGIKLFNDHGEKMDDILITLIEQYIDGVLPSNCLGDDLPFASGASIGRVIDYAAGRNRYIGYLCSLSAFSYSDVKIGLDCANGSLWMIAKSVFDALGARTFPINTSPNGININDGCGSTHIEALKTLVAEQGLDLGFAFDGDGDRCLCVDETGKAVSGDEMLYVLGQQLKEKGTLKNDTIVLTIMSNTGAENAMHDAGMKTVRTTVGDKYVYECMARDHYVLGGESCGHVICGHYANTGDGMVTALQIMDAVLATKKTLGQLVSPIHMMVQQTTNLRVADREKTANSPALIAYLDRRNHEIGETGGRILLRVSGTEPVIRLMVEHDERNVCRRYTDEITTFLRNENLL